MSAVNNNDTPLAGVTGPAGRLSHSEATPHDRNSWQIEDDLFITEPDNYDEDNIDVADDERTPLTSSTSTRPTKVRPSLSKLSSPSKSSPLALEQNQNVAVRPQSASGERDAYRRNGNESAVTDAKQDAEEGFCATSPSPQGTVSVRPPLPNGDTTLSQGQDTTPHHPRQNRDKTGNPPVTLGNEHKGRHQEQRQRQSPVSDSCPDVVFISPVTPTSNISNGSCSNGLGLPNGIKESEKNDIPHMNDSGNAPADEHDTLNGFIISPHGIHRGKEAATEEECGVYFLHPTDHEDTTNNYRNNTNRSHEATHPSKANDDSVVNRTIPEADPSKTSSHKLHQHPLANDYIPSEDSTSKDEDSYDINSAESAPLLTPLQTHESNIHDSNLNPIDFKPSLVDSNHCGESNPMTDMGDLVALQQFGPGSDSTANGLDNSVANIHINGIQGDHTGSNHKSSHESDGADLSDKVSSSGAGDEDDDNGSGPCGWGRLQAGFCQRFRDARWFLVVVTMCGACQGMAVNGFVNTVISTVERRFEISSTESGLIASCYDIMFVLLVIPISYFGGRGHKPRYLGIGIFVLGLGSFVFSLPHFITAKYNVENADDAVCKINSTDVSACEGYDSSSSLSNYKYFFFLGQLLHGAGATPLYTLGVTYIDENVPQRSSSFYNGIFYTGAIIGPAIGYMVGSEFLKIYTDLDVDPASLGLDPNNPKWVGAWWIGFIVSGIFGILLSLPLLAFPKTLPGSRKYKAERGKETQASKKVDETGRQTGLRDILLSIRYLLTNFPFMFINLAAAAEGILVGGFSTFMPKFIEYQFGVSAGTAALYVGLAVVPAGGGATFFGGFIVRCLNLKVRGILRLCIVASIVLCLLAISILMQCDTIPFAGVTLPYGQTNVDAAKFLGKNLVDTCNQDCSCTEEDYFPVCGRDNVMYFSPCYAGCTDVILDGDVRRYANCSCINFNLTQEDYDTGRTHVGEFGKCEYSCKLMPLFIVLFGFMIVFTFITSMPSLTATLRCVPDHQRTFGLGIQWIVARCLGSIPGPILFGKMFDLACLVWQKRCDGDGSCFFYDNHNMSINLLILALVFAASTTVFFILAHCTYKVKEVDDEISLHIDKPKHQSSHSSHNSNNSISPVEKNHHRNSAMANDEDTPADQSYIGTKL